MTILSTPSPTTFTPTPATPEDLLTMDQEGLFEIVDGEIIEKNPLSFKGGENKVIVIALLHTYITQHKLGKPLPGFSVKIAMLFPTVTAPAT